MKIVFVFDCAIELNIIEMYIVEIKISLAIDIVLQDFMFVSPA